MNRSTNSSIADAGLKNNNKNFCRNAIVEIGKSFDDSQFSYCDMHIFWNSCSVDVDYSSLSLEQKALMIIEVGFKIFSVHGFFIVKDMHYANIGNIEDEMFFDIDEILERVEYYFCDYFAE